VNNRQTQRDGDVQKERSMALQKELIGGHFDALAGAKEEGRKVVYTFVPGNLTELMRSFDLLPVLPEINALQSGMRKLSGDYISEAERQGHSEDVCTYVKCDIGMLKKGNVGPTGKSIPEPDLLLLSYTGCFTFMKWFELLRQEYEGCPVAMLHVPYQADGHVHAHYRDYIVEQLRTEVIPKLEKVSGQAYDEDKLRSNLSLSAKAEDDLVWVLESAKNVPSPIDAYFGGVYYIGPIFGAFRGSRNDWPTSRGPLLQRVSWTRSATG
jgi:benzoyl-CoA reductase subunit B